MHLEIHPEYSSGLVGKIQKHLRGQATQHPLAEQKTSIPYEPRSHLDSSPYLTRDRQNYIDGHEYDFYDHEAERMVREFRANFGSNELRDLVLRSRIHDINLDDFHFLFSTKITDEVVSERWEGVYIDSPYYIGVYSGDVPLFAVGINIYSEGDLVIGQIQGVRGTKELNKFRWRDVAIRLVENFADSYNTLPEEPFTPINRIWIQSAYNNSNLTMNLEDLFGEAFAEEFAEGGEDMDLALIPDESEFMRFMHETYLPAGRQLIHRFQQNYDHPALKNGYELHEGSGNFVKSISSPL